MKKKVKKIVDKLSLPTLMPIVPPSRALRSVTSKTGKGVYASSDTLFKGAVFGRDSLEVAEDLMLYKPRLVRNILLTLGSLQGEESNNLSEEEPGKIVHEYRTTMVDGKRIDDVSRHIFEELSGKWGGDEESVAYYGSIDATPHFIRVLLAYHNQYGDKILHKSVTLRSGHKLPMSIILENSVSWLVTKLTESKSGLLEWQARNPHGIPNQVWKDSNEFYIHENKELANHNAPIASIEVQGLAYDALMLASEHFDAKSKELQMIAAQLRDRTIALLWQPGRKYFALGADYDAKGALRIIQTMTANPAALLDTMFFDQLPDEQRQEYVTAIIRTILSREFLTDAGIRSRALRESKLIGFWDYHGSFVTWPKETHDIAKGLRRQGFSQISRELENRLLNVIMKSGQYPEFIYVDEWGRVLASSPSPHEHGDFVLVESTNHPESIQAWTVSAVMSIVAERLRSKVKKPQKLERDEWQVELEAKMLIHMPRVNRLFTPWSLSARYPTYPYKINKRDNMPRVQPVIQTVGKS
ncbi:MAG: hypothetical protein JWL85_497 [Candidatus Saccharibacteria bacterium]|nr:hypothetical protein [Candidatus Saccharibacteria bacterium]